MPDGVESGKRRPRKEQLERLIRLAQNYRGWNQKQTAKALERDPHNMVPDGGIPRLDLVLRLAETLDWPVDSVVDDLCGSTSRQDPAVADDADFKVIITRAYDAIRASRHAEGLALTRAARAAATTIEQRAYTYIHEYRALEIEGHYGRAIEVVQNGLRIARHDSPTGRWLRGYLANSHFLMGNVHEALGLAAHLSDEMGRVSMEGSERSLQAMVHSIRGNCHRVLATQSHPPDRLEAEHALRDLAHAAMLFRDQATRREIDSDLVGAVICEGAMLEVRVLLGQLEPTEAVTSIVEFLGQEPPSAAVSSEWPIALGWWCVYGCNIALRNLDALPDADRQMAILTNKADECASLTGNWALRERVWMIEHYRRRELEGANARGERWVLDREEIATLTGAMGRFPAFREIGWQVLSSIELDCDEGA